MRIPADAVLPYANEIDHFADAQGTRPVDGSSPLPADLPDEPATPRGLREPAGIRPERRKADRRKTSVPVTLDTRLTRSRRKKGQPSPVNIRV